MNIRKFTAVGLLVALAIFAQAMSAVDHIHLEVASEQECLICGSSASDALLSAEFVAPVVPASTFILETSSRALYQRTLLDLRSRAPPYSLDT